MKKFILLLIVSLTAVTAGCSSLEPSGPPNPGFILVTTRKDSTTLLSREEVLPGITTEGDLKWSDDDASGT